jgi:hypothetical protein
MPGDPTQRNPFSSSATRPGALPFHFPAGLAAHALIHQLACQDWWGQIVGPHGTGKTTLVATLTPLLEQAGRRVRCFTLHQDERRLPTSSHPHTTWDVSTQVIVDGYEQLTRWQRMRLKRACRHRNAGLLVTSHTSVGLPELYRTTSSLALAEELATALTRGYGVRIRGEDLRRSYQQHGPNLREVFFALYDVYESRRRG